jgi:hypothetical protein
MARNIFICGKSRNSIQRTADDLRFYYAIGAGRFSKIYQPLMTKFLPSIVFAQS